jgi:BirA family biotin operon repressor/biotin-[acetyl-CoA-carboxylase] ligase
MNLTILRFESIGSTNTEAVAQAKRGADEGLCIVAREQTGGRGRLGRNWVSEKDAGIYFSIVLRPKVEMRFLPLVTLMSAVAVFETLKEHGVDPDIKWPNDILVNDKKICGILAEITDTATGRAVMVGIGINLRASAFPPEIAETATSIEQETGKPARAEELLLSLTRCLSEYYEILCSPDGPAEIRRSWAERSSYFESKHVRIVTANQTISGVTRGLEENGALRVETANGNIEIIHAGDVERLRQV